MTNSLTSKSQPIKAVRIFNRTTCLMTVESLNNRRRMQENLKDTETVANKVSKTFVSRQDSISSLNSLKTTILQSTSLNIVQHAENLVYSDQFSEHSVASPNFSLPKSRSFAHRKNNSFNTPHLLSKKPPLNQIKETKVGNTQGIFNCKLAETVKSKYASNIPSPKHRQSKCPEERLHKKCCSDI